MHVSSTYQHLPACMLLALRCILLHIGNKQLGDGCCNRLLYTQHIDAKPARCLGWADFACWKCMLHAAPLVCSLSPTHAISRIKIWRVTSLPVQNTLFLTSVGTRAQHASVCCRSPVWCTLACQITNITLECKSCLVGWQVELSPLS